jgi:cell division protein FtsW
VQPSEVAKLAVVMWGASVTAERARRRPSTGELILPVLAATGAVVLLIMLEPDLGTSVIVCAIAFAVIVAAGASVGSIGALLAGGGGAALVLALAAGYRRVRLLSFLDPWKDAQSSGYQLVQSLLSLGSGGWTGVGLGASRQKWSFLPNAHTDFIFAIIGEELGLIGTLSVVLLFGAIAWSGLRIAARAPDLFGTLAATGITAWLVVQALENMGTVTGLLPVTGIPLPFVSYGMSQLITSLIGVGMLVSIGRAGRS